MIKVIDKHIHIIDQNDLFDAARIGDLIAYLSEAVQYLEEHSPTADIRVFFDLLQLFIPDQQQLEDILQSR
mgnify:FL=1